MAICKIKMVTLIILAFSPKHCNNSCRWLLINGRVCYLSPKNKQKEKRNKKQNNYKNYIPNKQTKDKQTNSFTPIHPINLDFCFHGSERISAQCPSYQKVILIYMWFLDKFNQHKKSTKLHILDMYCPGGM